MTKVVVGLSGGVDSSVTALLLLEQGYDVIGVFMKNWHNTDVTISDDCPWEEDSKDALLVAEKLGIPFQTIDLSQEYKARIVDYMFSEYKAGRTPNPDILCNREIKFDVFLKAALSLGADYVATGHYCQKHKLAGSDQYQLLSGKDKNKDQSYFLCQVNQEQLHRVLFPIGHLTKPEVRELAKKHNLVTADKKDSQGLCFIGKVRLPDFLQQQLKIKKGKVVEISADSEIYRAHSLSHKTLEDKAIAIKYSESDGEIIGEHDGSHFYTIGQRKGLKIGGKPEPLFVLQTDTEDNIIYVGMGENHPGLFRPSLFIESKNVHWVRPDKRLQIKDSKEFQSRIRYRQSLQESTLVQTENGCYLVFKYPQKAIAPGQFAAWYEGDELIGSGVIA